MSSSIKNALTNLIAPGGQMRLSPYAQNAIAQTIWGISRKDYDAWSRLLSGNEVKNLAQEWLRHIMDGGETHSGLYDQPDQLLFHAALIEHASRAIPQAQLILLDQISHFESREDISIGLIGETSGPLWIAVIDFVLAFYDVYQLFNEVPPLNAVHVTCTTGKLAQAHGEELISAYTQNWGELPFQVTTKWTTKVSESSDLAIIGTNELDEVESWLLSPLAQSTTVIQQPGTNAISLMTWRRDFLQRYPSFRTLRPCGADFGNNLPENCLQCSPRRREPFHATDLYEAFHEELNNCLRELEVPPIGIENLDWVYIILRGGYEEKSVSRVAPFEMQRSIDEALPLEYVGTYDDADTPIEYERNTETVRQLIRLCPAYVSSRNGAPERLEIIRETGKFMPSLSFGQPFEAIGLEAEPLPPDYMRFALYLRSDTEFRLPNRQPEQVPFLTDYSQNIQEVVDRCAHRFFGFERMRPFQHIVLEQVLTGRHILAIAATGGGKSECFILPALLLPGITIVVSPLKSLMQDQYDQRLKRRYGLGYLATYINGDVPFQERQARLKGLELGEFKLAYFTPEQLERSYVLESLQRANRTIGIRYIALDEAHCISQWGHDFRSSYLNIIKRLKAYDIDPIRIALTATASPKVREDLCQELDLDPRPLEDGGNVLVVSSNRSELNLVVRRSRSVAEKSINIVDDLRRFSQDNHGDQEPGAAIVFMPHAGRDPNRRWEYYPEEKPEASRRGSQSANVTRFASFVERNLQQRTAIYHGKMDDGTDDNDPDEDEPYQETIGEKPFGDLTSRTRRDEQDAFIGGARDIMIATKGFGMGIDKPNIRLVIHRSPTANLEAYAQEAGRAGRDGHRANVILYYSPDEADDDGDVVKSDYDIQRHFISNRYVRREDVILMRWFLRHECSREVNSRLYFTSDEVLRCFEDARTNPQRHGLDAPYIWPQFEPWTPVGGYFSDEHKAIMECGHWYKSRVRYIKRILDVLYRIRPDVEGMGQHIAFLHNNREVAIELKKVRRLESRAIVASNHYFGHLLRDHGISAQQFDNLLSQEDLIPFAQALSVSLSEASEILSDIRYSEGNLREKRWESYLLDLWLDTPKYVAFPVTLQSWRDYAGAWKRATPPKREGQKPSINGWFPWTVLNKPIGWEIEPGPAFYDDRAFQVYLDAFMAAHDERERNDWDAFYRLLTDYVGVNSDGTLRAGRSPHQATCLRAALLGYLKTNEVVVGSNCYSCNNCVPDENFDAYTDEQRRAAVVRMGERAQDILGQYEQYATNTPPAAQLEKLFKLINQEEKTGRSLRTYVLSWSGRLLQDTPGHRGALWLRAYGAAHDVFEIERRELLRVLEQLLQVEKTQNALRRLGALLDQLDLDYYQAHVELNIFKAEVAAGLGESANEMAFWQAALDAHPDQVTELRIHQRLLELVDDEFQRDYHAEQAGWLTTKTDAAMGFFKQAASNLSWYDLQDRIEAAHERADWQSKRGYLVWSWLVTHSELPDAHWGLEYLIEHEIQVWETVNIDELVSVIDIFGYEYFLTKSNVLSQIAHRLVTDEEHRANEAGNRLLLAAAQQGFVLSAAQSESVLKHLLLSDTTATMALTPQMAAQLQPHLSSQNIKQLVKWLDLCPPALMVNQGLAFDYLKLSAQVITHHKTNLARHNELYSSLQQLRDELSNNDTLPELHVLWLDITAHSPVEQADYIYSCLSTDELFPLLNSHWDRVSAESLALALNEIDASKLLSDRQALGLLIRQLFDREDPTAHQLAAEIILQASEFGLRPAENALPRIAEMTVNTHDYRPILAMNNLPAELAGLLFPYFAASSITSLLTWLRLFPAHVTCQDPKVAIGFLTYASEFIVQEQLDVYQLDQPLRDSLLNIRDTLLAEPSHASWVMSVWERIAAYSLTEKLNILMADHKRGIDIDEALSLIIIASRQCDTLTGILGTFENHPVKELPLVKETLRFHELLSRLMSNHSQLKSKPSTDDLQELMYRFKTKEGAVNALMGAITLDVLRARYNRHWLTPIAYTVQMYALAGRYGKARLIESRCTGDLTIGSQREPAALYIDRINRQLRDEDIASEKFDPIFEHIVQVLIT